MRIINISDYDKAILGNLDQDFVTASEMIASEREFLTALINEKKPKKVLEVGVASGGSSVVLLNALAHNGDSPLYGIDYNAQLYKDKTKKQVTL